MFAHFLLAISVLLADDMRAQNSCKVHLLQENQFAANEIRICPQMVTESGLAQEARNAIARYSKKELFQVFVFSRKEEAEWLHVRVYGFDIWKLLFQRIARTHWSLGLITGSRAGIQTRLRHGERIQTGTPGTWEIGGRYPGKGDLRLAMLSFQRTPWGKTRRPYVYPYFEVSDFLSLTEAQGFSDRLNREWYPEVGGVYIGSTPACFATAPGFPTYYWFQRDKLAPDCRWAYFCKGLAENNRVGFRCEPYRQRWVEPL